VLALASFSSSSFSLLFTVLSLHSFLRSFPLSIFLLLRSSFFFLFPLFSRERRGEEKGEGHPSTYSPPYLLYLWLQTSPSCKFPSQFLFCSSKISPPCVTILPPLCGLINTPFIWGLFSYEEDCERR